MPKEQDNPTNLFSINSDNQDFAARQKDVFAQLNVAEMNRINEQKSKAAESSSSEDIAEVNTRTQRARTKAFRGQKSIFKTPAVPLRKSLAASRIPDYRMHPHKWTRYSLEDVDTSERSNTAAAMSFLKEIESRKSEGEMETDGEKKIVFRKSVIAKSKLEDARDEETMRFRSSKVVMPEYVVGQKIKNDKKKRSTKNNSKSSGKELKLDHLMEDEDEDNPHEAEDN